MRRSLALTALLAVTLLALPGCAMLRRRAAHRPRYARVSPPIAYEMIRDSPGVMIIDLRSPQAFNGDTGHLFRAHNIPLDRLPYRLLEISPFRDDTFLVYCDTQTCAQEGMAILISSGFEDAVLVDGGIDAWIRKGFRTVLPGDLAGHAAEREENGVPPPPPPPPVR